jgi:hypothetical protein
VPVNAAFDCGAAAATTPRHSHEGEDQVVANLLESLDLDLDFAPGLGELARPLLNLMDPVPRPGVREMDIGVPDNVLVEHLNRSVEVASVPQFIHTPYELHVLLRHRLLRQPHGFEGFA